jgi:ectoine hydroxylase-related dioxygenase (phytanoyl-CoA dioxygenase family)
MELAVPIHSTPEPPVFRSRYGGLWTDRNDAHDLLADLLTRGEVTKSEAQWLAHYIDHGYVVFPKAVDEELVDEYLEFFERAWDEAPDTIYAHSGGKVQLISRDLYDKVAKVSCLHWYFPRAGELIFPPPVLRFLTLLYQRPPVAFQTMSMRKGSEEPLHIDTGPLTLTEPMTMAASWVALEDVQPHSGEFEFVPGSHLLPEVLNDGTYKGHNGDMIAYGKVLQRTREMCEERGLKTERFVAKKGDVLIWHADLMHGGAPIEDPERTRKSLVAHFMPLGVMPTFYDFSRVSAFPYDNGGYCLDNLLYETTRRTAAVDRQDDPPAERAPTKAWKEYVPLPMKAFVRKHVDRLSASRS